MKIELLTSSEPISLKQMANDFMNDPDRKINVKSVQYSNYDISIGTMYIICIGYEDVEESRVLRNNQRKPFYSHHD